MSRLIIITISLIALMFFAGKAFWLKLNGYTTIEIIDRFPILIAPANYVYFIWFIVFIFLFLWVKNYFSVCKSNQGITLFQTVLIVASFICQIISVYSWHFGQFLLSLTLLIIHVVFLFILYLSYPLQKESIKLRLPIAIYFGWSFFLLLLISCYILLDIGWHGFGLSGGLWAVIIMTLGTAIALHLRYHHFDIAFPLVFVWCYLGIAVANSFDELLVTTAALFLSGVMIVGILFIKKTSITNK